MIERPMPQDIMKFKAKLMAGLTARQILWGGVSAGIALGTYFLLGDAAFATTQTRIIVSALPALPAFAIGFMPVMGMPLEKVAVPLVVDNFISPAIRKKEIKNPGYEKFRKSHYGEYLKSEADEEEQDTNGKKKKKKKKNSAKYKCVKSQEYVGIK